VDLVLFPDSMIRDLPYVRFDLTVTEHTQWWRRCRLIECGAGGASICPNRTLVARM